MIESILLKLGIAASAEAGKTALRAALRGDELERLFAEIEKHHPDVPGLTSAGLAPLREDSNFLEFLALYWMTGAFPRDAIVAVLERHLGQTPDFSPRELAGEVADDIDRYGARARASDRELFAIEALRRSLEAEMQPMRTSLARIEQQVTPQVEVRFLNLDTAPPLIRQRLRQMVEQGAADLAPLQTELEGVADPRTAIEQLACVPPRWLSEGSARTWEFLGEYAGGFGLWAIAAQAFEEAAERPQSHAGRPALLARAAENYWIAGDEEAYRNLLAKAESLDPSSPAVILARLRPPLPAQERLALLAEAPDDLEPRPRAALDVARAMAHLELHQWTDAKTALASVRAATPENIALRELEPSLVVAENTELGQQGRPVDVPALRAAAAKYSALRDDLVDAFRFGESAQLLARAATALGLAGHLQDARQLLETIRDEERQIEEARVALATAGLTAHDFDFARSVVPQGEGEPARLLRAELQAGSDVLEELTEGVEELDELVSHAEDPAVRTQAAFSRQVLTVDGRADPNPEAERVLREARPELDALLRAQALIGREELDAAESVLIPHTGDPRILQELARIAAIRDDWPLVVERLSEVVARTADADARLLLADAQARAGQTAESLAAYEALARDPDASRELQVAALSGATQIAMEGHDYAAVDRLTRDLLGLEPGQTRIAWARLFALHRLGRSQEALRLIEEHNLDPDQEDRAELYAAVLSEGDLEVAVRRIMEVSDRFDRPERLEGAFLWNWLRIRKEERLEDIADQVQERFVAFPERFPQSRLMRQVSIDTTPEGVQAFLAEHIAPAAEQQQEIGQRVRAGELPLATFAGGAGRPVVQTAVQLTPGLPMGFGDPSLDQMELESARAAIARGVVWDSVSLAVVASLAPEITDKIRPAFPGSVIAQATMDDLHRAVENPQARGPSATLGYDPTSNRGIYRNYTDDEIAVERELIARAMEIAQAIEVRPNFDASKPTELDDLIRDSDPDPEILAVLGSVSLAAREGMALYSDDRFVRLQARRVGLSAFGTASLLDALVGRDILTEEERLRARQQLRRRGVLGLVSTLDELLAEGRAVGWRHETSWRLGYALIDPTAWSTPRVTLETLRMWGALLKTIFEEAPDQFEGWVARVIDAGKQAAPRAGYRFFAESLILASWRPMENPAFLQALIETVRGVRRELGWLGDPVAGVAARLSAIARASDSPQGGLLARLFFDEVSFPDQLALFGVVIG